MTRQSTIEQLRTHLKLLNEYREKNPSFLGYIQSNEEALTEAILELDERLRKLEITHTMY